MKLYNCLYLDSYTTLYNVFQENCIMQTSYIFSINYTHYSLNH